jgi:hypothetical protein
MACAWHLFQQHLPRPSSHGSATMIIALMSGLMKEVKDPGIWPVILERSQMATNGSCASGQGHGRRVTPLKDQTLQGDAHAIAVATAVLPQLPLAAALSAAWTATPQLASKHGEAVHCAFTHGGCAPQAGSGGVSVPSCPNCNPCLRLGLESRGASPGCKAGAVRHGRISRNPRRVP